MKTGFILACEKQHIQHREYLLRELTSCVLSHRDRLKAEGEHLVLDLTACKDYRWNIPFVPCSTPYGICDLWVKQVILNKSEQVVRLNGSADVFVDSDCLDDINEGHMQSIEIHYASAEGILELIRVVTFMEWE